MPSPLASLARHAVLALCLVVLGAVTGAGVAFALPRTYSAEARVALAPATTSAYTVPGYSQGSRDLIADYARWVENRTADYAWAAPGVSEVVASPIPESAVLRVETKADSPEHAVQGAAHVVDQLTEEVKRSVGARSPDNAYRKFMELQPKVASAQADVVEAQRTYDRALAGSSSSPSMKAARDVLIKAQSTHAELQLEQDAQAGLYRSLTTDALGLSTLKVVAPAASTGSGLASQVARSSLVGAGLGYIVAQLLSVALDRRRGDRE